MRVCQKILSEFNSLLADEQGSSWVLIGLSILVILGATGSAIDTGRAQLVQAKLSASLDAAGLAAGAVANSEDVQSVAEKYFYANFPSDYMNVHIHDLIVTPNADNTVLNLSVKAEVDTTFMLLFGFNDITVSAASEITRSNKGMELVLVMDNTGSMASNSKLQTMKNAAISLVNILYGDDETLENFWVGLVPYSQSVNVGNTHADWLNPTVYASYNYGPDPWAGCVDARPYPADTQDDPPVADLIPYYWADHNSYNNWIYWGGSYASGLGANKGPNKDCPQEVTPMTKNKATIINGINSMQAQGYTHANFGMVWGWRMLSPKWRSLWNGDDNDILPLDYEEPLMNKVAILLTDGVNTHSNAQDTAYGYLWQGVLGTTSSSGAVNELNDRLAEVCANMKAQGVIIYTITFQLNNSTTQTLFRNCATKPDFYFNSPSNAELQTIFNKIADSLANLRISK